MALLTREMGEKVASGSRRVNVLRLAGTASLALILLVFASRRKPEEVRGECDEAEDEFGGAQSLCTEPA